MNSLKRLEEKKSRIKRSASKRGEPIGNPKNLEIGKLAKGRDGTLWIVSAKETTGIKIWKKF
jgi:hypothetical protein